MTRTFPAFAALCLVASFLIFTPRALAAERFVDNGDGTITDTQNGLMWTAQDNAGPIDWISAKRWATFTAPYSVGGNHEDWRLPTIKELETLMSTSSYKRGYESDCGLEVGIVRDITLTCAWVWAADEQSILAGFYNFQRGAAQTDRKVKKRGFRALAVRSVK